MKWQIMTGLILLSIICAVLFVLIWRWKKRRRKTTTAVGTEFEKYCAQLLAKCGFKEIEMTKASGDFGVDIFAQKDGISWAFQCKCYDKPVGVHAVQEIYSGRDFYHCMVGVVMTNSTYTSAAVRLAEAHNILLWDGAMLAATAKKY